MLSAIGRLDLEDSIYTAILPNNDAWNSAFENRLSYHKIFVDRNTVDPAADSARMMLRSKLAIVQDLVYRGQLVNPEALNNSTDSLVSTNYNVFYSPGYLFQGLTPETLSNGVVYTTDALRYKNHESWQYPIRVEAEWDTYGRTENLCQLTTTTMASTPDVPISNNRYIYCEATSTGSLAKIFVTFPIPNVLSAKYNVYVYMLPSKISKPAEHATPLEGKVRCYMYYTGADGLEKTVSTSIVPVSADTVTKILVAENFEFPYWNPLLASTSGTIDTKSITTKVRVENSVSNNEHKQGKFDRIMRIDCIRFEPVEE